MPVCQPDQLHHDGFSQSCRATCPPKVRHSPPIVLGVLRCGLVLRCVLTILIVSCARSPDADMPWCDIPVSDEHQHAWSAKGAHGPQVKKLKAMLKDGDFPTVNLETRQVTIWD